MPLDLLPWPARIEAIAPHRVIGSGFRIARRGAWSPRAEWLIEHFLGYVRRRAAISGADPLVLEIRIDDAVEGAPRLAEAEGYRLDIGAGKIDLVAGTTTALARALATLIQLVEPLGPGVALPALRLEDAPRMPWRGLMLDVARRFLPMTTLESVLHGMALLKLNVLHLHLSDDQGFRFESRLHPAITAKGSAGRFYSRSELRALVRLAARLGIRVVPELDMPGHVASWLPGAPDLAAGTPPQGLPRAFGISRHALDPTREETYRVIGDLLAELCEVFCDDYVHIGGDEVHPDAWQAEHIVRFMRDNGIDGSRALQARFNRRVAGMLSALGRIPMAWDEVLDPALPEPVCVQAWRGSAAVGAAAASGHPFVVSSGLYLDLGFPAAVHRRFDPHLPGRELAEREAALAGHWSMQAVAPAYRAFLDATRRAVAGDCDQRDRLLGVEACLWGELVDADVLDVRLWDRLCAVAELAWGEPEAARAGPRERATLVLLEQLGVARPRGRVTELLARLGCDDPRAVWPLIEALAPLPWYGRHLGAEVLAARAVGEATDASDPRRPYDADTPLNRIVDLLPVDDGPRQRHRQRLGDPAYRQRLAAAWRAQYPLVERLARTSPAFAEILPMSRRLRGLGDWLLRLEDPDDELRIEWAAWRDGAREPVAETLLAALDLVDEFAGHR